MTRALGVFVVLMAFAATATAEKTADKAAPAKKAQKADAKKADAKKAAAKADADAADESAEGADEDKPLTPEELEASLPPHINGPKVVDLGNDIQVAVPEGMLLLERAEARKMLEQSGDYVDNVLGVVAKLDANWLIVIEFNDIGYVSDKDANELDAGELFKQFQDGNVSQNAKRKSLGVPELYLDGWSEMPSYKAVRHHLVWGLKGHSSDGPVINFFTRILGRNGYMSVNLIDTPDAIEQSKKDTQGVLDSIQFKDGSRYEDYKEGDKNSGIGLKTLVLGGAGIAVVKAAKAGFLIKLLLVFKKGFILVFAAIGGFFKWLFGRKKSSDDLPPDVGSSEPPSDGSSEPPASSPEV